MNNRIMSVVAAAMLITLTSGCCSNMRSLWFGRGARCGLCSKSHVPKFGNVMQAPCGTCATPRCASPAPVYQAPQYQTPQYQAPQYQAPQYQAPQYQAPQCQAPQYQAPQCQAPTCQSAPAADCGCNSYAGSAQSEPCGTCHSSGYGDCGCGAGVEGYPSAVDPYLSGGTRMNGSTSYQPSNHPQAPRPGEVINGETVVGPGYMDQGMSGQVLPGTNYPGTVLPGGSAPISPDNFQQRPGAGYPQGNYQSRKFDTDGKKILWEQPLPSGANAS